MMLRHGDVILSKIEAIPDDAVSLGKRKELAYGEVTGHAHRIDVGELFETRDGKLYLKVKEFGNLSHEEHATKTIDPGVYFVGIKRQYTPGGWESVRD